MTKDNIRRVVEYCCNQLDLPAIKIRIIEDTYWLGSFIFGEGIRLEFNLERLASIKSSDNKHLIQLLKYAFRSNKEMRFFVIAHEIAHYLQYSRHNRWMLNNLLEVEKYLESRKKFSHMKYNKFKIEANANKIALILLKKAKREGFKL